LPRAATSALSQLWRQAHFDERRINREVLRVVARLVSQASYDAGLSLDELILGVTASWLRSEGSPHTGEKAEPRLQWAFAKLVALSVDEFHRAIQDSQAQVNALELLRLRASPA